MKYTNIIRNYISKTKRHNRFFIVTQGEFKEGKKQGRGTYFYLNGDTYVGGWENNRRTGDGTKYYEEANSNLYHQRRVNDLIYLVLII